MGQRAQSPSFCGAFLETSENTYIISHWPHLIATKSKKYLTAKPTSQGAVTKEEERRDIIRQ